MRAALRSVLVPGWGQIVTAHRQLGWSLVAASFLLTALVVAFVAYLGPLEVVARLADPDVMLTLLGVNLAVAATRLASTEHAWREGGGQNWAVASLLAVVVLAPHAALAWLGVEARATLVEVFDQPAPEPPVARSLTPPPSSVGTSFTTHAPTTTTTRPVVVGPPTMDSLLAPPTRPPVVLFGGKRLNLLLLGSDSGPRRSGIRTDTVIVASIDPASGDAALFGLPRNLGDLHLPDGTPIPGRILNEIFAGAMADMNGNGGPEAGAAALGAVVHEITGLEVDYFALVDLTGFADVVDALGGVTLDVPHSVYGPLYDPATGDYEMVTIPTGPQTLDGGHSLAYVRARLNTSDYDRMGRQRCLLVALAEQADPADLLTRLPSLLDVLESHVSTDIPLEVLPDLIRLVGRIDTTGTRVVGFDPSWSTGRNPAGYPIPDVGRIRQAVNDAIGDRGAADRWGIPAAEVACS